VFEEAFPLPKHLGGHKGRTHIDVGLLKWARDKLNVKSMLDLGCGPGGQVYEAQQLGLSVIGVDGDFTLVRERPELFVVHDFTKGKLENFQKYYLTAEFDLIWCVEFVEHIDETYVDNWMSLTQKGRYVFMTYSDIGKPGHHHVNCKPLEYWINLYKKYGFTYDEQLTNESKEVSTMKREFWKDTGLVFERKQQ